MVTCFLFYYSSLNDSSEHEIFYLDCYCHESQILKRAAKRCHAARKVLSKNTLNSLRLLLYAIFQLLDKKKEKPCNSFLLYVRRIAMHFLLHNYNKPSFATCQYLFYNFKSKSLLHIDSTIIQPFFDSVNN